MVQGALPRKADVEDEDNPELQGPVYPTVIQQALNNMRKFSNCVVLTRVGNFYELYFGQAEVYSKLLNLKLASKPISLGRKVPMSGFPYFQLDRYLKILVQDMNRYVAIVEEFANDAETRSKSGGLMFDRRVARVITPGTLIDEKFMDPWENNFVLAISYDQIASHGSTTRDDLFERTAEQATQELGIAWLDLSSGDFFTQKTTIDSLSSVLARIGPREIIIDPVVAGDQSSPVSAVLSEGQYIITRYAHTSDFSAHWASLTKDRGEEVIFGDFSEFEVGAGSFLLEYVNKQLQGNVPNLRPPMQRNHEDYMTIDRNSLKALEIKETMRDGGLEGSLLHAVRKTVTKSGHRLLCQRLMSPSTSTREINERLDLVTELLNNAILRDDLVTLLTMTFDSWRLLQKFSFGKGDADDLLSLAQTIRLTAEIRELLLTFTIESNGNGSQSPGSANKSVQALIQKLEVERPAVLADRILESIDEEKLSEQHRLEDDEAAAVVDMAEGVLNSEGEELRGIPKAIKGRRSAGGIGAEADKDKDNTLPPEVWIMRPSASAVLQELHDRYSTLLQDKDQLAIELRQKSGAQTLNLKWTPGLGHIIHLKGRDAASSLASLDLGNVRPVSSSKSTRSFHHPLWTQLGGRIDDARLRIRAEESRVFAGLREKVIENLVLLRRNAAVLDELDVASSFAALAHEKQWSRPILNYGFAHDIIGGRHSTVEANLTSQGRTFTPNDCVVGADRPDSTNPRILLITGPNMAGKSTFLRQNALISILAQTGSYVPAAHASIGIVDAVLSRVGSADSLHSDQSTFMVEMLETAHILRVATPRSFVVMDEVGRGTTPEDGIAVSYAALEHLALKNKCRSLFATHFHVLADMTSHWESVECLCTDVVEDTDAAKGWSFVHKVRKGVNRDSHALKVARLAGMPESVVDSARAVLERLKMGVEERKDTMSGHDSHQRLTMSKG